MQNPYESPLAASQPLDSLQSVPRQWRLAAWLGVFIAFPAIAMSLMLALRVQQWGWFVFLGSLAFSIVGFVAMLRQADCPRAAKVTIFLLAVFCSLLAATLGVLLLAYMLEHTFGLNLFPYEPMDD